MQYLLAIDRTNDRVAYLYHPMHPAVLRTLERVLKAARAAKIPVSICGEMAGDPLCVYILLGLGIDELSLNAGGIPTIKKIIRHLSIEDTRADIKRIMRMDTAEKIHKYILKKMRPLISTLDEKGFYSSLH